MTTNTTTTIPVRSCGPCYACCVHLGIDELKKWSGQSCKHLDGRNGPEKRCNIYNTRPNACVRYQCGYIDGMDIDRPDQAGFIVTPYPSQFPKSGNATVSIIVFDKALAGTYTSGRLNDAITQLVEIGIHDIRIVYPDEKHVIHVFAGEIYAGTLLPQKTPESLIFETYHPRLATYTITETKP